MTLLCMPSQHDDRSNWFGVPGRGEGGKEGGREGRGREGGKKGGREGGKEGVRDGGKQGGKQGGREGGREGGKEGCRLCVIVLHTMPFEIAVMGSQRSGNVEGLAMQIHHWVQKVRRRQQLYISKVFLCHSISIIGTSEQQL